MAEDVQGSAHDQNLIERKQEDEGGIGDSVSWTIRQENGVVVKGPDADEWAFRDEAARAQAEENYRDMTVGDLRQEIADRGHTPPSNVKKEELVDLLLVDDTKRPPDTGLPPGYVNEELSMKGPDPTIWERDAEGNYVNR